MQENNILKPDFAAKRRQAKLLAQQRRNEKFLYKVRPWIAAGIIFIVIFGLAIVFHSIVRS